MAQTLTIETPHKLQPDCGCLLETGDEGRPLFVPCRAHDLARRLALAKTAAELELLRDAARGLLGMRRARGR